MDTDGTDNGAEVLKKITFFESIVFLSQIICIFALASAYK